MQQTDYIVNFLKSSAGRYYKTVYYTSEGNCKKGKRAEIAAYRMK